jgi:hypothetical protein
MAAGEQEIGAAPYPIQHWASRDKISTRTNWYSTAGRPVRRDADGRKWYSGQSARSGRGLSGMNSQLLTALEGPSSPGAQSDRWELAAPRVAGNE